MMKRAKYIVPSIAEYYKKKYYIDMNTVIHTLLVLLGMVALMLGLLSTLTINKPTK
jgi:uncharacterized membrane protein